jgi:hypothetical protein
MMDTMQDKRELGLPDILRGKMFNKTMVRILEQRPYKETQEK